MIAFQVNDMNCGHCVSALTEAIQSIDKHAKVTADIPRHLVMVEPAEADAATLAGAIKACGYSGVAAPAPIGKARAPQAGGPSCCGCCH